MSQVSDAEAQRLTRQLVNVVETFLQRYPATDPARILRSLDIAKTAIAMHLDPPDERQA